MQFNLLFSVTLFIFLVLANRSWAQVISDDTLPTRVKTKDDRNFVITEGSQSGNNLFHSFSEFSVPTGGSAVFDNSSDIQRIISRVTGSSISNIDGLIKANGNVDVLLLNPNGIIFGSNAALNVGGSFLASTASSLIFADGNQFSAIAPTNKPLLTVNVPVGLQFGQTAGSIVNQSQTVDAKGDRVGLQVRSGQTLALMGGDINLVGGVLTAPEGQIDLGSVAPTSLVNLTPTNKGWNFSYENVQNFQDIQLSDLALVNASGLGSGGIQLQGRNVVLSGGSKLQSDTFGSLPSQDIVVNASDTVYALGTTILPNLYEPVEEKFGILVPLRSGIFTNNFSGAGDAGNIFINARQLAIRDGAHISTTVYIPATGNGGNIVVNAVDGVELAGTSILPERQARSIFSAPGLDSSFFVQYNSASVLASGSASDGAAGNITINTGKLIIRDGGLVQTSPLDAGAGGDLTVNASRSIELNGTAANGVFPSGLFTSTFGSRAAGNLTVRSQKLRIQNGARISSATFATGQGGNLSIYTSDSVELSGAKGIWNSGIQTETRGTGDAGKLTISTDRLSIQDGAEVTVRSSLGIGDAGDLEVTAHLVLLDNKGKLTATTEFGQDGGNITLNNLDFLLMRRGSEISTDARSFGNGGNVTINSNFLIAVPAENSDIKASAIRGNGGRIQISTRGIFGIQFRERDTQESDITASSEFGIDGVVEFDSIDADPGSELASLPQDVVEVSELVAPGCQADIGQGANKFVVTGRGGLPPTPREALASESPLVDLGTHLQAEENHASAVISGNSIAGSDDLTPTLEAQGWVINAKGEVMLTAQALTVTPDVPWSIPANCYRGTVNVK